MDRALVAKSMLLDLVAVDTRLESVLANSNRRDPVNRFTKRMRKKNQKVMQSLVSEMVAMGFSSLEISNILAQGRSMA